MIIAIDSISKRKKKKQLLCFYLFFINHCFVTLSWLLCWIVAFHASNLSSLEMTDYMSILNLTEKNINQTQEFTEYKFCMYGCIFLYFTLVDQLLKRSSSMVSNNCDKYVQIYVFFLEQTTSSTPSTEQIHWLWNKKWFFICFILQPFNELFVNFSYHEVF